MRASIDIGSNSILLLIAEIEPTGLKEIVNLSTITGLGRDLDKNGYFCDEAIEDSFSALEKYSLEIKKHNVKDENIIVTATEASRVASNATEFITRVKEKLGLNIQIINAEGEAYYTALGVTKYASNSSGNYLTIMDIGGASTEFIRVQKDPFSIEKTISLPIGSVRGTDWLRDGSFDKKVNELCNNYPLQNYETDTLICVAGSMTSLATMLKELSSFNASAINGEKFGYDTFCQFVDKIKPMHPEKLLEKYPFLGKRSRTIYAGAEVAKAMGRSLNINSMQISTYGLRYGTLIQGEIDGRFTS
jgi:exopolyphosphatase/guanosine-5'-triphosphate,3'-diphosphate pyrophosphatase